MSQSINHALANLVDGSGASVAGGLEVYATKENLPTTGLTEGDQAYVSSTRRFYISNGSGWYNVALANATPALTISPTGEIQLDTAGSATTITLTATDSDNSVAGITFSVESDGNFGGLATLSQDSSVFTITPLSEDSATTTSSTLTFKASDGISFGSGTRDLTLRFTIPNSKYTESLLKADASNNDDNQVDASTNSTSITEYSTVTSTALSPYHPGGYSYYFDGSGDYINVTGTNVNSVGSVSGEAFTIEFWYNYSAVGSQGNGLVTKGTAGSTGAGDILTIDLIPGTRYIGCTLDGSYSGYEIQSSTALKENVWYHIALVKNSSNLYTLYINGKADGTYSATGTISASSNFYIGTNYYSPTDANRSPQGIYSDVRVVSDAVYTTNFAPPTAPLTAITNTELLTCTNKNDIWDVGTGRVLTKVGNTTASNTKRKFTTSSAIYFDGTGDEIQTLTNNFFSYGTGDFTWEFWMNPSSQGTYDYILTQNTHTSANGLGLYLQGGVLKLYHNSGAALTGSTTISNGTWYHVALAREGTNLRLFLDGSLETSTTNSANILTGSTYGIVIGRWTEIGDGQYYDGYLQDVRVTRGLARYTTNFTPPTAEFAG